MEYFALANEIAEQLGNVPLAMSVQNNLGVLRQDLDDIKAAQDHYERALVLARREQHQYYTVITLHNLGCVAAGQGEYDRALALFDESIQISNQFGFHYFAAVNHLEKGSVFMTQKQWIPARHELLVGLERAFHHGEKVWLQRLFGAMAVWCERNNESENGVRLLAGAERLGEQTGQPWQPDEAREIGISMENLRQTLGVASFRLGWDAGHALTTAQMMKLANA